MSVSLVIPGKNCARTIRACLDAVIPFLNQGRIQEILFVDDGSTDETARVVGEYPVRILAGPRRGPGAARNVGWRAASADRVWFIDADCVANADTLDRLERCLEESNVVGAGGGYGNMLPGSALATLIHEEMEERGRPSDRDTTFLRSSNMLFERRILEELNGFDECRFNGPDSPGAEDMELAYRAHDAGYRLRFDVESRVGHFHPQKLRRYLRAQRHHGYWRVWLYYCHPRRARGDSYTTWVDHIQPPLAMAALASLIFLLIPGWRWLPLAPVLALAAVQLPMTMRLMRRTRDPRMAAFAPLSFVRAFWRGLGMSVGALSVLRDIARGGPRRQ